MRSLPYKLLLLASSLLLALSACSTGPVVPICSSYPEQGGFRCVDAQQKSFFIAYKDSKGLVAMKPEDLQVLIDYWRAQCGN
jgi:hypothetical protein